jgi:predicted lipoprotein with Yx(FWY)xxD motif
MRVRHPLMQARHRENSIRRGWGPTAPGLLIGTGLLTAALLVAAACGSSSHNTSTATSATTGAPAATSSPSGTSAATVKIETVAGVGPVLVNSSGRTLYMLTADHQSMVSCTSTNGCTGVWPPLDLPAGTTTATPGSGVQKSLLSTIKAPDGMMQVTYNHWPLYTFAGDSGPGQAKGQGITSFGGTWWALNSAGQLVTTHAGGSPTTTAPKKNTGGSGY